MSVNLSDLGFPIFVLLKAGSKEVSSTVMASILLTSFADEDPSQAPVETLGCWVVGNPDMHPEHVSIDAIEALIPEFQVKLHHAFEEIWTQSSLNASHASWEMRCVPMPLSILHHAPFKGQSLNALSIKLQLDIDVDDFQKHHDLYQREVLLPWVESLNLPYLLLPPEVAEKIHMIPAEMFEKDAVDTLNLFISSEALIGVLQLDSVLREAPWGALLKSACEKKQLQQLPSSAKSPCSSRKI